MCRQCQRGGCCSVFVCKVRGGEEAKKERKVGDNATTQQHNDVRGCVSRVSCSQRVRTRPWVTHATAQTNKTQTNTQTQGTERNAGTGDVT